MKLNADQLRKLEQSQNIEQPKRFPLYLILDNVWDTYNIGGLFRLADALAAEKIFICGQSEIPPNHKIAKASVGTYKIVPWEYRSTAVEAIEKLRAAEAEKLRTRELEKESLSIEVVAVEQTANSIPYTTFEYSFPLALVVGNETHGVSKGALDVCDATVEIPLYGVNTSLNVIISAAIVGFYAYQKLLQKTI